MLIEFRVENFRSFRDEQVLSMVAGRGDELPGNTFETPALPGKRLLKSAVIYGANAAGKSNVVQAVDFFLEQLRASAKRVPGDDINSPSFLLDTATRDRPSRLEVSFTLADVRYQYGFAADAREIVGEWLYAYPEGRARKVFGRKVRWNDSRDYHFGRSLGGQVRSTADRTLPNALFLSKLAQDNHKQVLPIFKCLRSSLRVVDLGAAGFPSLAMFTGMTAKRAAEDSAFREVLLEFLRNADVGVSGLDIRKASADGQAVPEELQRLFTAEALGVLERRDDYEVSLLHRASRGGAQVKLQFEDESFGTQKLFALAFPFLDTLRSGYTLFVDELNSSMHPMMTRHMLSMFHNASAREARGQLVFACHDTTLLDNDLFRRDQIYFVEKDEQGASHLYSLQDYKPRKGEALQRGYLEGRYGAVPFLGELQF